MVNLNAPRNLPQDSTPWGKSIERRLSDLEKEVRLSKARSGNTEKNLNTLTTGVYDRSLYSVFDTSPGTKFTPTEVADREIKAIGPTVTGYSRTGRLFVAAPISLWVPWTSATQDSGSHSGNVTITAVADTMGPPQVQYNFMGMASYGIQVYKDGEQARIYSGGDWNFPFMTTLLVRPGDFSVSFRMDIFLNHFRDSPDWSVGSNVPYTILAF